MNRSQGRAVRSGTTTVAQYLAGLPLERRTVVSAVRKLVRANLPGGYRERIAHGMICYEIPLERFPDTHNKEPLLYAALGAGKSGCTLHLTSVYADPARARALRAAFKQAGKRPDMGKACVRFRKSDDLPSDAIADLIASLPPAGFIRLYQKARGR